MVSVVRDVVSVVRDVVSVVRGCGKCCEGQW